MKNYMNGKRKTDKKIERRRGIEDKCHGKERYELEETVMAKVRRTMQEMFQLNAKRYYMDSKQKAKKKKWNPSLAILLKRQEWQKRTQ